jgi:TRAP-type C4-dicarboxylate transport system substrate-binding protein
MPKDLQDLIVQVTKEAQAYENKLFLDDEASLEQFMKDHGMTVVNDVDKAAFAAKALPGVEGVLSTNPSYKDSAWPLYQEAKASLN